MRSTITLAIQMRATKPTITAVTLNRARGHLKSFKSWANGKTWISPSGYSGLFRLPLSGFTYSWTLSSKFFSTFPHGTCSLSVSWLYLALDGVYHLLRAALSSNPTLRRGPPEIDICQQRAWHPLGTVASFKMDLGEMHISWG